MPTKVWGTAAGGSVDESNLVHKSGTETITGDKTFTASLAVTGDIQAAGGSFLASSTYGVLAAVFDYVNISASVNLQLGGVPTLTGYNLTANEGGTIPAAISGGEILYSNLGTLYLFDAGASNKTVYLNYDTAGVGVSIIVNIGAANNIIVDADGGGSWSMTSATLTPGQFRTFAGESSVGGYTIYRVA